MQRRAKFIQRQRLDVPFDVRQRPKITIMTEATVETLILEKQDDGLATTGVQLIHQGERRQVFANAEVILAAGAIAFREST